MYDPPRPAGERIRQKLVSERREKGIASQAQMAELMGCSVSTVQRLESPDGRLWWQISRYWQTIQDYTPSSHDSNQYMCHRKRTRNHE